VAEEDAADDEVEEDAETRADRVDDEEGGVSEERSADTRDGDSVGVFRFSPAAANAIFCCLRCSCSSCDFFSSSAAFARRARSRSRLASSSADFASFMARRSSLRRSFCRRLSGF
jgi:hypothetical protein